ncbi:MAG: peptidase S58 family protein, partial [Dehalococcoidia bacterium]|nr:peptidase S58 family protein [Dehalococcoidia bacterium]
VGAIVDPETGELVAGPRGEASGDMRTPEQAVVERVGGTDSFRTNTTLVCIATNADIEHVGVQRLAVHGHDGLARSIVPAHTLGDGDTVFALTTGEVATEPHDLTTLGLMAMLTVERAVVRSVELAEGLARVPSAAEWREGSDKRG